MKFATVTGLLATAVMATPADKGKSFETITIKDFLVRKNITTATTGPGAVDAAKNINDVTAINVVEFKLSGRDATDLVCIAENPDYPVPSGVETCAGSKYRFSLHPGDRQAEFKLQVFHELATAAGFYGNGSIPVHCRAGGAGPGDYVCEQPRCRPGDAECERLGYSKVTFRIDEGGLAAKPVKIMT